MRQALAYAIDRQRDRRVPAPRSRHAGRRPPAAGVLGVRARRLHVHLRSGQATRAARRGRLSGSRRRRPAAAASAVAEGVEHRVQPAAVVGDPAEPPRGRHRARRAHVRVRDALRRRPQGQLPAVHAAVGRRRGGRSRHPAPRLPLEQVPPAGFNRGHFSDPRVDALLDEATASTDEATRRALYARRAADPRRGGAVHQPLVQDQRRRRQARPDRHSPPADRRLHVPENVARTPSRDARRALQACRASSAASGLPADCVRPRCSCRPEGLHYSVLLVVCDRGARREPVRSGAAVPHAADRALRHLLPSGRRPAGASGWRSSPKRPGRRCGGRSASRRRGARTSCSPIRPISPTARPRRCPTTRSSSTPCGRRAPTSDIDDWLRLVFTHEFTHIVHLDRSRRLGARRASDVRTDADRVSEPVSAGLAD